MKKVIFLVVLLFPLSSHSQLPEFYHTYAEAVDTLLELEALHPDIMDLYQIGTSTQDSIPIWAVKISDSVQFHRDKPRLIFVGIIHAEENIGLELCIDVISEFVNNHYYPWTTYTALAELFFIPCLNPEGLNVVTDTLDLFYRKNKRDNVGDGFFRFIPGMGFDSSGVDLNRNFGINWIKGDTLFQGGQVELYDYYRGPAPFSEGEVQALKNLAQEQDFSLGAIYHQSRSTNLREKVIYSWGWEQTKFPPDFDAISDIGTRMASLIHNLGISGTYEPNPSSSRYGNTQDWFYCALNCYQYTVETSGIQPSSYQDLLYIIDENKNGFYFLIQRAIGYTFSSLIEEAGQLTGNITDALTGAPIEAEVGLAGRSSGMLSPRRSDPVFGRYRFYLVHGSYTLQVSAPGYADYSQTVSVGQALPTIRNVSLQPLPLHQIQGSLTDINTGQAVEATLYFSGNTIDTIQTSNGSFALNLPESQYQLRIDADGYVSRFEPFNLTANMQLDRSLSSAVEIFTDGFENGMSGWFSGGDTQWDLDYSEAHSGSASIADSPGFDYGSNIQTYIQRYIDLAGQATAHLTFWHKYYLEPEYDFATVEVSIDDGVNWEQIAVYDLQNIGWQEEHYDLTPFCPHQILLRFILETDANISELGWNIDDISVQVSDQYQHIVQNNLPPYKFCLLPLEPNPFNGSALIRFSLERQSPVKLTIYNVFGQQVQVLFQGEMEAGNHSLNWEAVNLASGIYFIYLEAQNKFLISKALLLK